MNAEAQKYSEEHVVTTAGTPINYHGTWMLWGSVSYSDDTFNNAKHLYLAADGGSFPTYGSSDPVGKLIKLFRDEIAEDCYLPTSDDTIVRSILKELMDEGDFCPNNKMLERGSIFVWSKYRKVLLHAVKSGRFQTECQSVAVQNSLDRSDDSVSVVAPGDSAPAAEEQ